MVNAASPPAGAQRNVLTIFAAGKANAALSPSAACTPTPAASTSPATPSATTVDASISPIASQPLADLLIRIGVRVMIAKLSSGKSGISQAYWRNRPITTSYATQGKR